MKRYMRSKDKPRYFANMCTASEDIEAKVSFTQKGMPTECEIVFNSPLTGKVFDPIKCKSVNEALKLAKEWDMPYNIFVGGEFIKSGWRG